MMTFCQDIRKISLETINIRRERHKSFHQQYKCFIPLSVVVYFIVKPLEEPEMFYMYLNPSKLLKEQILKHSRLRLDFIYIFTLVEIIKC